MTKPHPTIELNLRDGSTIDRAEQRLAHAIAIVSDDWAEARILARTVRDEAFAKCAGLTGRQAALSVAGLLDRSRSRLPA